MALSGPVPWYDRPAREFPVKRWQRERFAFSVSIAPPAPRQRPAMTERRFPALVWL